MSKSFLSVKLKSTSMVDPSIPISVNAVPPCAKVSTVLSKYFEILPCNHRISVVAFLDLIANPSLSVSSNYIIDLSSGNGIEDVPFSCKLVDLWILRDVKPEQFHIFGIGPQFA